MKIKDELIPSDWMTIMDRAGLFLFIYSGQNQVKQTKFDELKNYKNSDTDPRRQIKTDTGRDPTRDPHDLRHLFSDIKIDEKHLYDNWKWKHVGKVDVKTEIQIHVEIIFF